MAKTWQRKKRKPQRVQKKRYENTKEKIDYINKKNENNQIIL